MRKNHEAKASRCTRRGRGGHLVLGAGKLEDQLRLVALQLQLAVVHSPGDACLSSASAADHKGVKTTGKQTRAFYPLSHIYSRMSLAVV